MKLLGITGGSGAGKTTLLNAVADFGGTVIDCDAVYHRLLATDAELLGTIDAEFPGVVSGNVLDRRALGAIVFADVPKLEHLNAITHKFVDREVSKLIAAAEAQSVPLVGIDAIALIESGLSKRCDTVVAVVAPVDERVRRLMLREGISEEYALSRINAQKSDEWFIERADHVLYNTRTEKAFAETCNGFISGLLNSTETV
jgi:dephospho-CoA kinase